MRRLAPSRPRRCEIVTVIGSVVVSISGQTPSLPAALPPGLMAPGKRRETSPPMPELKVRSGIAGSVWKIEVAVGDAVGEEDPLIILESMKMEIPLLSPRAGVVREILVAEGDPIGEGDIAVILE